MPREDQTWTLLELAEKSKTPARTIRFYITRGLLPGPLGAGRGAVYGEEHFVRLQRIRSFQERGMMLAEIAQALDGAAAANLPQPVRWLQYALAADVHVSVRADGSPWRLKQVRKALEQFSAQLGTSEEKEETDGPN